MMEIIYIGSRGGHPVTTLTEYQRVTIVIALLAISVFLTYYFHTVLMLGTVFSHFFYIPIILTALWWEKRSILVAIFLEIGRAHV